MLSKADRLPRRSAVVAFSAADVYQIAEFIKHQRGGAAVVMGRLSPQTRNAQVDLYQNGDVDFLIATDAIEGANLILAMLPCRQISSLTGAKCADYYLPKWRKLPAGGTPYE